MDVRRAAIVSIALLATFAGACQTSREPEVPRPGQPALRVMTYNVNFGLAGDAETLAAFSDGWADIVLLQETTPEWEAAIRAELGERYPHMTFQHAGGAGGLAVLSKVPFATEEILPPVAGGWFPSWVLVAQTQSGPLQVLHVHLRPQLSDDGSVVSGYFSTPPIREREIESYFPALDPKLPTLVVGDFNEGPDGRAVEYLEERGFVSGLSEFDTDQDTWRWTTSVGTFETQLDHIAYNDKLRALDVRVLDRGNSDHRPVVGTFEVVAP